MNDKLKFSTDSNGNIIVESGVIEKEGRISFDENARKAKTGVKYTARINCAGLNVTEMILDGISKVMIDRAGAMRKSFTSEETFLDYMAGHPVQEFHYQDAGRKVESDAEKVKRIKNLIAGLTAEQKKLLGLK